MATAQGAPKPTGLPAREHENNTAGAHRDRRSFGALGSPAIMVLFLGSALITAAMGILAFLWRGSMLAASLAEPGHTWRAIASAGWAPRTVTICTAAIRIAITAQAALVAPMVASLLLERFTVPLHSAPFLSIVRAVGIQPAQLLYAQGTEVVQSSAFLCFPALVVAGLIAMASHFTSTILLSDFDTVAMVGNPNTSVLAFSLPTDASGLYDNIWAVAPMAYPRFAEHKEPPSRGESFEDTGFNIRALLPFQESGRRTSLRKYAGPASVFDARVLCVRPTLEIFNLTARGELFMTGRVIFDGDYPPALRVPDRTLPMDFVCALSGFDYQTRTPWDTSVCRLRHITNQYGNADQPSTGYPYLVSPLPGGTRLQLVLNMTKPELGWGVMTGYNETFDTSIVHTGPVAIANDGPWASATFGDAVGAKISVTACFSGMDGFEYQIVATSDNGGEEPELAWTGGLQVYPTDWSVEHSEPNGTDAPSFRTEELRRQLGATDADLTPAERGILSLDYSSINWNRRFPGNEGNNYHVLFGRFDLPTFDITQGSNTSRQVPKSMPTSLMVYQASLLIPHSQWTHRAHVALFVDALISTGGSAATALQAWHTTLFQLQYMDEISRFSVGSEATYELSTAAFVPARWAGFIGVCVIVVLHLLVTACVTVWYLLFTRHTMLGNSWQAIAQVASDATMSLVWQATGMRDGDVKAKIGDDRAVPGRGYSIVQSRISGRRELSHVS